MLMPVVRVEAEAETEFEFEVVVLCLDAAGADGEAGLCYRILALSWGCGSLGLRPLAKSRVHYGREH
jgi:hypothetical protein